MKFLEKLRQEQNLKKKNETRLNPSVDRLQPLMGTEPEWISSQAPRDPQEILRKALAKRRKKQPETTRPVDELLPDRERSASILGGRSLSNELGSYIFRLSNVLTCPDLRSVPNSFQISGLVSWLKGRAVLHKQVVF
jgi:hypothetical protein